LLVVAFIPVIAKIMELVYEILPQKLLKALFELLESFKLVAIWYYLLMVLGVLATLALIYFLQKKLFSHQRLMTKRISKGLCQQCGIGLAEHAKVCHGCGYHQFKKCPHCHHATYAHAEFCTECGQPPQ
jgi:ribosomal protein L40E